MTVYCDDFPTFEGDLDSHEGWRSERVFGGKVGDKNLR